MRFINYTNNVKCYKGKWSKTHLGYYLFHMGITSVGRLHNNYALNNLADKLTD